MTTIVNNVGDTTHVQSTGSSFVVATGQWVTTSDHKKIGRLFVGASLLFAVVAAVTGAILGFERMTPDNMQVLPANAVVQVLALYHFALVFGVLAPLFVGIAIAVVPMQVGSRAIALPRLAQYAFWAWFFGALLVIVSIIGNGGPGGGNSNMVDLYLLGLALAMVGVLAGSLTIATTVLTSRTPGMTLDLIPAFSWAALVGSVASLLSLPVALGTIVYLYVDHEHTGKTFGVNGINTHLGWALSAPLSLVFIVMALGVLAEVAPVTARIRQPLRPVVLAGLALATSAVLGAVTQSTHVFAFTGSNSDKVKSAIPFLVFNGLPLLGILITIAVAMLSLKEGKLRITAAFVFALFGSLMILVGAAGNFVGSVSSAGVVGTSFSEGTTLYFVYGGVLSALGALTYWAPKLWGRVLSDTKVLGLAALGLLGTIASSFPMYIAGFANQPADKVNGFHYGGPIAVWNGLAGLGHALLVITVLGFVGLLVTAVRSGEQADDDPFDGHTLEWAIPSPAPANNFAELPLVNSSEPVLDAKPSSQEVSA